MLSLLLFVTLQAAVVIVQPSVVEGDARKAANVDKFLEARKDSILACSEKLPKKKGSLALRFLVLTTGKVAEIEVMRSFDAGLAACVTKNMGGWVFPPAEEGVRVSVEYKLKQER